MQVKFWHSGLCQEGVNSRKQYYSELFQKFNRHKLYNNWKLNSICEEFTTHVIQLAHGQMQRRVNFIDYALTWNYERQNYEKELNSDYEKVETKYKQFCSALYLVRHLLNDSNFCSL